MIYLKNNTETQTIYIPRQTVLSGGYIATTKTYEDGYRDGLEDGKKQQKDKLLNLYVTENGQYEREDGWNVVTVDVPDLNGSYDEGYAEGERVGYNQGKTDGINEQKSKLETINITENGTYTKEDGYNEIVVEVPGSSGDYNEGYEQGQADMVANAKALEVTENGQYGDGKTLYKTINVNVPSIDDYNYHILTAIGGVVDYGDVPFNVITVRQNAYNITSFWSNKANAAIENGNLSPNVLVHSLIVGTSYIGAYSFQNMKRLTDITIYPRNIGDYAFANCSNLNRITIYGLPMAEINYTVSNTAFEGVADKGVVVLYDDFFNNEERETWVRDVFMTKLPNEWTYEIIQPK